MDFDLAIIGAGPAGLSFALSLRHSGLRIVVIERQSRKALEAPALDGRDIALTHLSRRLMQQHGSWQRIEVDEIAALQRAEVLDGNSPYTLSFETPADDTDALGFLVSNHVIRRAIFEEFSTLENITLMDNAVVAQVSSDPESATLRLDNNKRLEVNLIVAADSRFSSSRRQMGISSDAHDFGRSAVLCWMEHERDHQQTAFECFHYGRTLAILPLNHRRSSVVVTAPSDQVEGLLAMSKADYAEDIQNRLNGRLGGMQQIGDRFTYPLVGVHANRFYANRYAVIGDAAVGMHPVTAHGFNLGLSGQDLLAGQIHDALAGDQPYWSAGRLQRYQRHHMLATRPLYHGTNAIVSLFTNDSFPASLLRQGIIRMSNNFPPIKSAITHKLMSKNQVSLPGLKKLGRGLFSLAGR